MMATIILAVPDEFGEMLCQVLARSADVAAALREDPGQECALRYAAQQLRSQLKAFVVARDSRLSETAEQDGKHVSRHQYFAKDFARRVPPGAFRSSGDAITLHHCA